jgi:hypothetical protein
MSGANVDKQPNYPFVLVLGCNVQRPLLLQAGGGGGGPFADEQPGGTVFRLLKN